MSQLYKSEGRSVVLPRQEIEVSSERHKWIERLGEYVIAVEEINYDVERYRSGTSQRVYVCEAGSDVRIFEATSSVISGHLLRKGSKPTGSLNSRASALEWLITNIPAAKKAYADLQHKVEVDARQKLHDEVVICSTVGPFQYLNLQQQACLGTDRLAGMLNISTRRLNTWLVSKGYLRKENGRWVSCKPELSRGHFGTQVRWTAVGIQTIWTTALSEGLTSEPLSELLKKLRSRFGWGPAWVIIDEAQNRREQSASDANIPEMEK